MTSPQQQSAPIGVGDTVMMKSGGPRMKVVDVGRHTGQLYCEWQMEGKETGCSAFHPEILIRLDAPSAAR